MIEHFVIMGIDVEEKDLTFQDIENNNCQPKIISLYPSVKSRPTYLENYKIWCFPDEVVCYSEDLKTITNQENSQKVLIQDAQQESITEIHQRDVLYHFVMTDEKADRRYCTALLFYEKKYVRNEKKHNSVVSRNFPKIPLSAIMRNPLVLDEDTQVIYVPKSISLISSQPTFDPQRQFLVFLYKNFILKKDAGTINTFIPVMQRHFSKFDQLILQIGLFKTEEVWDQQQTNYEDCPKKLLLINNNQFSNDLYKREPSCRVLSIFTNMYTNIISKEGEVVYKNFISLHKTNENQQRGKLYQSLISLLHPSSRSIDFFQKEVNSEDPTNELLRFRSYKNQFMTLQNFSYKPLFKRLSFVNITKLIIAIIQEQQILLFSSSPGEIPLITESLLTLIKPFTWSCIYIPFSPIELWEYSTAIQPFIIGFSKVYKEFVLENIEVTNKVIVDLDDDNISYEVEKTPSSPFESVEVTESILNLLKQKLFLISQNLKLSQKDKAIQWVDAILRTRQAFFGFIVQIVKNIIPFLRSAKDRVTNQIGMSSIKNIFEIDSYISSFKEPERNFIEFISKNTMMFTDFVERVDSIIQNQNFQISDQRNDDSLTHYIKTMSDQKSFNQNLINLDFCCEQSIAQQVDKYNNPESINVYPYLIKYLKFLDLSQLDRVTSHQNQINQTKQDQSVQSENVLYFFNNEQRKQTRLNLNTRDGLFKSLNRDKLVDLKHIFTQDIVNSVILKQKNSDHDLYDVIKRQSQGKRTSDQKRQTEIHLLHKNSTSQIEDIQKHKSVLHLMNKSLDRPLLKNKRYSMLVKNTFQGRSLLEDEEKHQLPSFDPKPKPSVKLQ